MRNIILVLLFIVQSFGMLPGLKASDVKDISQASIVSSPKILILYGYNYNLPIQQLIASGLQEAAKQNNILFGSLVQEYLDIPSLTTKEQRISLRDYILKKYQSRHFDLIMTVFEPAADFFLKYCAELSPGSPCILLFDIKRETIYRGGQEIIQVPLTYDFTGTLNMAIKLFPETERIVFVSGKDGDEVGFKKQAINDFSNYKGKSGLSFEYTDDKTVDELIKYTSHLPQKTVILYTSVILDITGKYFVPRDVALSIAKTTNSPMFCLTSTQLGTGVIGGSMVDVNAVCIMLETSILKYFNEKKLEVEPVSSFYRPMFDWTQLMKRRINIYNLPDNSIYINRPANIWDQYRNYVISAVFIIFILLLLIVVMGILNARIKKAEKTARDSEVRFRALSEDSMIGVYILQGGLLSYINPAMAKIFGYEVEELIDKDPFIIIHPDDHSMVKENIRRRIDNEVQSVHYEYRGLCKNGDIKNIEAMGARVVLSGRPIIIGNLLDITENKNALIALKESETRFRALFENAPVGVFYSSTAGKIIRVNKEYAWIMGYDSPEEVKEIINRTTIADTIYFHPEERSPLIEYASMVPGKWIRKEKLFRRKDGTQIIANVTIRSIPENSEILEGFIEDVTEQKEAERALKESETKFRVMFENSRDAIGVSKNGIYAFVNPAYLKMYGCSSNEELYGTSILDQIAPGYRDQVNNYIQRRSAGEDSLSFYETRGRRINGTEFYQESNVSTYELNGEIYSLVIVRDITERKQAEQELEKHRNHLEELVKERTEELVELNIDLKKTKEEADKARDFYLKVLQDAPVLIWQIDNEAKCDWANKKFLDFTGRTFEEQIGDGWMQSIHPDDLEKYLEIYFSSVGENKPFTMEYRLLNNDGNYRWILNAGQPLIEEENNFSRYIEFCFDIDGIKNYEKTIKDSLAEKEMLLREIHHRVKNNLNTISSLLYFQSSVLNTPEAIQAFQESQNRIQSMARIHEHLYHSKNLAVIDMQDNTEELLKDLKQIYSNQEFTLKINAENISLDIERAVPCGLLINEIVSNALKYAFKNNNKPNELEIMFKNENKDFILMISDNGTGLPENINIENLTTLGLRLIKMLVAQLKGVMTIESEKGKGTKFKIIFPMKIS